MAVPTSYNEVTLGHYMIDVLGEIADVLEWSYGEPTEVWEAVNDTLIEYGASTVEEAMDIEKLRVLARWKVWRAATDSLAARYNFTNPEGRYDRNQMLQAARASLADAEYEAVSKYDVGAGGGKVRVTTVQRNDPYVPREIDGVITS